MITRLRMQDGSPGFSPNAPLGPDPEPEPEAWGLLIIPDGPGSPRGVVVPELTAAMLAIVALVPSPAPLRADLEFRKGFLEKTLVPIFRRSTSSPWFLVGGR
jgi:hypothetical protein